MKIILGGIVLLYCVLGYLTGCVYPNNEEIVRQYKICKDAGMCVGQGETGAIRCIPCREAKP